MRGWWWKYGLAPQANDIANIYSIDLNGIDEGIQSSGIFSSFNFNYNDSFSVDIWINPDNVTDASRQIVGHRDPSGNGWLLWKSSANWYFYLIAPGGLIEVFSTGTLVAGVWQHLCATFGGAAAASVDLYRNAVAVPMNPRTDTLGTNDPRIASGSFTIGKSHGSANYSSGRFDQCTVWNRVLTAGEVTERYNGGVAIHASEHSAYASAAISSYKLGEGDNAVSAGGILDSKGTNHISGVNTDASNIVEDVAA